MNPGLWRKSGKLREGLRLLEANLPVSHREDATQETCLPDPDGLIRRKARPRRGFVGMRAQRYGEE